MDTPAPRRRFDLVAYLKLVRFPLVFTAIADSAAGYFIGRLGGDDPITPTLGLLALSSAGLYLSGMALNDIADLDKDRQSAPSKALPSGRVSRRGAISLAVVLLGLSFLAACLAPGRLRVLTAWGAVVVSIL
ncbi:MAG: UbiA family prenyltransferase, partial [Planctomycetaceae bacterium]|nr:UbiA family prenyltransferase [Planctomycetaceae bacterium]